MVYVSLLLHKTLSMYLLTTIQMVDWMAEAVIYRCSLKGCLEGFHKTRQENIFAEVAGSSPVTLLERDFSTDVFL